MELLHDQLSEGLECPKCNQPFGSAQVPYMYVKSTCQLIPLAHQCTTPNRLVGCGHTICIGCILSVLEVVDGGSPGPYECPICLEAIDAPPRRDVKSEQLVCWLQLAQGDAIDTPHDISLEIFDEYFANSGYMSEEV